MNEDAEDQGADHQPGGGTPLDEASTGRRGVAYSGGDLHSEVDINGLI